MRSPINRHNAPRYRPNDRENTAACAVLAAHVVWCCGPASICMWLGQWVGIVVMEILSSVMCCPLPVRLP